MLGTLTASSVIAATVDEAIGQLETATTNREQSLAVVAIKAELRSAWLDEQQFLRLSTVLATANTVPNSYGNVVPTSDLIRFLREQQQHTEVGDLATTRFAESLASDAVHNWYDVEALVAMLAMQIERGGLPNEALTSLRVALEHGASLNRAGAIQTIALIPASTKKQWERGVADLVHVLRHSHVSTRLEALKALRLMGADRSLGGRAHNAIETLETTDEDLSVRLEALELMLAQTPKSPEPHRPSQGNLVLINELLKPTPNLWRFGQNTPPHLLKDRALVYLRDWYDPNYPHKVVQALIEACKGATPEVAIDILERIRLRDGLSDAQLFALRSIAADKDRAEHRDAIYRLGLPNLVQGSLVDARQALTASDDVEAQLEAAHLMHRQYRNEPIPEDVYELASTTLEQARDARLVDITSKLVAAADTPLAAREVRLVAAMRAHPNHAELQNTTLSLFADDALDAFAVRYAGDQQLPRYFRARFVRDLSGHSKAPMPEVLRNALLQATANTWTEYQLVSATIHALKAREAEVPLGLRVKERSFQSGALFGIWVVCLIASAVLALMTLIAVLRLPLSRAVATKRTLFFVVWAVAAVAMLGFLGLGFIGFIGHNSAPAPSSTFNISVPMYWAFAVYAIVGVMVIWWSRQRRNAVLGSGR